MTGKAQRVPFWKVVFALLGAARKRTLGRWRRQMRQRYRRGGRTAAAWPLLGFVLACVLGVIPNLAIAFYLALAVPMAERIEAEARGRVVVEEWFAGRYENRDNGKSTVDRQKLTPDEEKAIATEATRLAKRDQGNVKQIQEKLRNTLRASSHALLSERSLWWQPGRVPDAIALLILLWWALMLVCQGEGPDFDTQRARNPMWEWLFSHPVQPSAVFLAEMLAPIAANPIYITAPIVPGVVYGVLYGWQAGVAAAFLVGIPATVALACVGKAVEISVLLRLSMRARGAVLGLMGWFGYASMLFLLFAADPRLGLVEKACAFLLSNPDWPWPLTRALAGMTAERNYSFWQGLLWSDAVSLLLIASAVASSVIGARRGMAGQIGLKVRRVRATPASWFGRQPMFHKELLWFRRDGGALVQAILLPLSLAAMQAFNLRGLIANATDGWQKLAGMAVLFGTYFLLVLGPKSLASEGSALWLALTWPRGLEDLLKAKAKLWALLASIIVALFLAYATWRYPADFGRIIAVALVWLVFANSLAQKTVTLATVTSPSGEPEKVPASLRWASSLGTFTFAIGIFTQQWSMMVAGVVYSVMTAAAMWQNFRFRLPYLFDPWSEKLPPPPTLLHAMVGISGMIEGVSVVSAIALALSGRSSLAIVNAASYAICAIIAATALSWFLASRGVPFRCIWFWTAESGTEARPRPVKIRREAGAMVLGAALGGVLGLVAHAYLWGLHSFPDIAHLLDESNRQMRSLPNGWAAYFVMAVAFAPFAEEFVFRGLLYRSLDREWGGIRAVLGAAAFFAVYHPLMSWPPVAALAAMNAVLFKRLGSLTPAVAAHMAYNAVVLAF